MKKPENHDITNEQTIKTTKKRVIACKVAKRVYTPCDKILACKPLKKRVLHANIMSVGNYADALFGFKLPTYIRVPTVI